MRAELGTNVRSRDDKPLGSIEWVLVDPDTRMVKSIGVRHGIIREHAIKIPLHEVHPAKSLDHLVAEVDEAPTRHLTRATVHAEDPMPEGDAVAASTSGGVFPANAFVTKRREAGVTPPHSELSEMIHMVDADVVVLGDGSDVFGKNMQHIGELEQIRFETHTGQLLSIVIKRGVLHHQEFELPGELIGGVDEGSIYLNVDRDEVREHILKNR